MTRVGLSMIVKNEAHVIERCLASCLPLVDWWVIVDTGSTDGTQDLIRAAMSGIPGELHERPWVDFGHNRQEALDLAREHAAPGDYALWIDADETLTDVPPTLPDLTTDGCHLSVVYGNTEYHRLALVRLERAWSWVGAIHEYLDLPGATTARLPAPGVHVEHAGARSLDPETYLQDIQLLEAELAKTPDDPRLQFYLAQSWRDAGDLEMALERYAVRARNPGGWEQETWFARFQVAVMTERLLRPEGEVCAAYLSAYDAMPSRAEPLVELARFHREKGQFHAALLFARPATRIARPEPDALFVDTDVYAWRAWDELSVSCYWAGLHDEAFQAATRALAARPDDERLRANLAHCSAKLVDL